MLCAHNINTTGMHADKEKSAEQFEDEKKEMGEQMEKLRQGMRHVAQLINGSGYIKIRIKIILFYLTYIK